MRNGAEMASGPLPVVGVMIPAVPSFVTHGLAQKASQGDGARMVRGLVPAVPAAAQAGAQSGTAASRGAKMAAFLPSVLCVQVWPRGLFP
jgi:hypothetical protein